MRVDQLEMFPGQPVISPYTMEGGWTAQISSANLASGAWPSADRAIYMPFRISVSLVASYMFVHNGAAVNGNFDIGIYDKTGVRLVSSGATAQAGVNSIQTVDITDTRIGPGLFYLALVFDNTTATTYYCSMGAQDDFMQIMGMAMENSAYPLPATATFAVITSAYVPVCGLTVSPRSVV